MVKKFLFVFILYIFSLTLTYAQEGTPWWFILEQGRRHYRNNSYGQALISFENARLARIDHFTRMEEDLIRFLSTPGARQYGDTLDFVEWYAAEIYESRVLAILEELYHYVPRSALDNSVNRVLEELDILKRYPEAEFWLGETFRMEGELVLAQVQYQRALRDQSLFQTPNFELEVLYRIAYVHRTRGEFTEMESRYREIIEGNDAEGNPRDNLWMAGAHVGSQSLMRAAMLRILQSSGSGITVNNELEGVNQFLNIYRHNNMATERAHRQLGLYLYSRGRYTAAMEHLMFAFLIQNTVIIEDIIRREFDFTFSSLEDLMQMAGTRRDLLDFMEETEYFRTIYYFSSALHANGRTLPAVQLWNFLAQSNISGEWGNRARRTGVPVIESVIVMP